MSFRKRDKNGASRTSPPTKAHSEASARTAANAKSVATLQLSLNSCRGGDTGVAEVSSYRERGLRVAKHSVTAKAI